MKLSDHTIKILENFVGINSGIVIKQTPAGESKTTIRTVDRQNFIYAQAEIEEAFSTNVCLYDLKAFLSVLSAFKDAEIVLKDTHLIISEGDQSVKIVYADAGVIHSPKKEFTAPETQFSFDLEQSVLAKVLNMSAILSLPQLKLFNKKEKLFLQALDKKNPNTNTFEVQVGTVDAEENFSVFLTRENMKMIPGDYTVSVNTTKAAEFKHAVDSKLVYYVALEANQ